jgi:flagellin
VSKDGKAATGDLTINGSLGSKTVTFAAISAKSIAAAQINNNTGDTGVTATAKTDVSLKACRQVVLVRPDLGQHYRRHRLVLRRFTGTARRLRVGDQRVNAQTAKTGVTAQYDATNKKRLKLTNSNGNDISLVNKSADEPQPRRWTRTRPTAQP